MAQCDTPCGVFSPQGIGPKICPWKQYLSPLLIFERFPTLTENDFRKIPSSICYETAFRSDFSTPVSPAYFSGFCLSTESDRIPLKRDWNRNAVLEAKDRFTSSRVSTIFVSLFLENTNQDSYFDASLDFSHVTSNTSLHLVHPRSPPILPRRVTLPILDGQVHFFPISCFGHAWTCNNDHIYRNCTQCACTHFPHFSRRSIFICSP